jgi:D-alanyl-D-alanine carboxypeptidase
METFICGAGKACNQSFQVVVIYSKPKKKLMNGSNRLILVMVFFLTTLFLLFYKGGLAQQPSQQNIQNVIDNFFSLYNSGDTAAYRKFLAPVSASDSEMKQWLAGYINAYNVIGQVDVKRVQINSAEHAEVWVQDKTHEAWWKFSILTDSLHHFKRRYIQPAPFESYFIKKGKLSNEEIRKEVEDYVHSKLGPGFAGNVCIAKGNELIYCNSFGNDPQNNPNTFSQQFDLASMGKMFTAISILQLRDKGLLSLDDKVQRFVPELKNKAVANVTIKQLLTHTSGMGDFFEHPLYAKWKDSLKEAKDFLPIIEDDKLSFQPGTNWQYSNTGFSLLALIIERASRLSFNHYVEQNIFIKSIMKNSIVGGGAGGGYSTVNDLHHFAIALQDNILLDQKSTQELLTYTVNGKYGYGTEHQLLGDENIVGHSGGFENVCTELNIYTHSNYVVIILSNCNPPLAHFLSNKIKELLVRS